MGEDATWRDISARGRPAWTSQRVRTLPRTGFSSGFGEAEVAEHLLPVRAGHLVDELLCDVLALAA